MKLINIIVIIIVSTFGFAAPPFAGTMIRMTFDRIDGSKASLRFDLTPGLLGGYSATLTGGSLTDPGGTTTNVDPATGAFSGIGDILSKPFTDVGGTPAMRVGTDLDFKLTDGSSHRYSAAVPSVLDGDNVMHLSVTITPEPSAWAMLITGFGAVGAVMRRRRANGDRLVASRA